MDSTVAVSGPRKVCMNLKCGKSSSITWKPGWSLRSGLFCELCEGCGLVFEEGRFCETFHYDDAGWRTCNSCKKRVHCGCIASVYSFVLLDTGGVECRNCANNASPGLPSKDVQVLVSPPSPQRALDTSILRDWGTSLESRLATPVDAEVSWQPLSSEWCSAKHSGFLGGNRERLSDGNTSEATGPKKPVRRTQDPVMDGSFVPVGKDGSITTENHGDSGEAEQQSRGCSSTDCSRDMVVRLSDPGYGSPDICQDVAGKATHRALSAVDDVLNMGKAVRETYCDLSEKTLAKRQNDEGLSTSTRLGMSDDSSQRVDLVGLSGDRLAGSCGATRESKDLTYKVNGFSPYRSRPRQLLPRPLHGDSSPPPAGINVKSNEVQGVRVARPPGQGRGRNQLLPRYWPRITDQELQQLTSGDSNTTITPLFEKMLSASDAGRIGRLVLPKACAEAYFPPISQPEGVPMKIQDINGKEWVFQFRFWPNNNSRMYVLEGVTPCIQSMQLQAGDTVTFSRLDPDGKLVMGYRRAPATLTSQVGRKHARPLGGKTKRLRLENEDSLELKSNWEEVQELLRPPPYVQPTVVTIEGHDFEEYEEPPICTKRTIFNSRLSGEQDQWAQCDDCGSWRKVPFDALVLARWTCLDNKWDPERASCSTTQEISNEDIDHLLGLEKDERVGDILPVMEETSRGLDALAHAAAMGVATSPAPARATTKHPRHRSGCTCIVCIQPPSGKGPKHKQNCLCNVCVTVKRRFKTLMLRRKKRLSERDLESQVRRKHKDETDVSSGMKVFTGTGSRSENSVLAVVADERRNDNVISDGNLRPGMAAFGSKCTSSDTGGEAAHSERWIDLNSQPDREMESSKVCGKMSMRQLLQDARLPLDIYMKQQGIKSLLGSPHTDPTGCTRRDHSSDFGEKKGEELSSSQR